MGTSSHDLTERQVVWSRHWAGGASHSCAGSYDGTYGGAIAEFWRHVHAATQTGARILDLASGSGAVPRLLLQSRPGLPMTVHAVDLSTAAPQWLQDRPAFNTVQVLFHAGTRIESLPLPSGSIDLVTSQYGIEYGDAELACQEVRRVLAPAGRVAFVMHHAASRPVQLAEIEIGHIDWLMVPGGLVDRCAEMLRPMALAATPEGRAHLAGDAVANASRRAFNEAQTALNSRIRQQPDGSDVLGEAQDAAAQLFRVALQGDEEAAHEAHARWRQHLQDSRWRLNDLRCCALDATAASGLVQRLGLDAASVRIAALKEGEYLMAWSISSA